MKKVLFITLSLVGVASAGVWVAEAVDSGDKVGKFTALVLNDSGYPHISYFDVTNHTLKYARWDGAAWQIETVDSEGNVGWYTSLALDSSGYPHISYFDCTNSDLKYARWDGNAWQIETVDSEGQVGDYTSLVLDSNDYPNISYNDGDNRDLKYARWNGAAWQLETVDSGGQVGTHTSLALDSLGYPHISYRGSADLKYARWDGAAWQIETVVEDGGEYSSLALDSNDHPHISCLDFGNGDLKYAHWDGAQWRIEAVDETGDTGYYTSLALDSSGLPRISYYGGNRDLKYAGWEGDAWQIEAVDTEGFVGQYTSLALDSFGNPRISYFDSTNEYLKYAFWNEPPPFFNLLSPPNGETIHDWPLCDWEDVSDYPGVVYDIWYSTVSDFSSYSAVTNLTDSEYQFSDTELDYDTTYYWKVRAWDGYEETWSIQTDWWFYVAPEEGVGSVDLFTDAKDEGVLIVWRIEGDTPEVLRVLRSVGEGEPVNVSRILPGSAVRWLDTEVETGIEYHYWLEVVEEDGTTSHFGPSEAVAFPGAAREIALSVYPSPAEDSLTVVFTLPDNGRVAVALYDLSGRRVATVYNGETDAGRHDVTYDLTALTTGVYLMHLDTDAGAITRRVVITR